MDSMVSQSFTSYNNLGVSEKQPIDQLAATTEHAKFSLPQSHDSKTTHTGPLFSQDIFVASFDLRFRRDKFLS